MPIATPEEIRSAQACLHVMSRVIKPVASLDRLHAHARDYAHARYSARLELMPTWLCSHPHGTLIVIETRWRSQSDKDLIFAGMPTMMRALGIDKYSLLTEAWAVEVASKAQGQKGLAPSEHPERFDIVVIVTADKEHHIATSDRIVRKGWSVTLERYFASDSRAGGDMAMSGKVAEFLRDPRRAS